MAVAFVNSGASAGTVGTTGSETVTPGAPASLTVGNIVVVMAGLDKAGANGTIADISTATSGWAEATDTAGYTGASPFQFLKLFWKTVDSTSMAMPGVAFTWATTGNTGGTALTWAHQFSGVDTTTPFGTSGAVYTAALATATTTGPMSSPGTVANGDLAFAAAQRSDDNATTSVTVTTGWTNLNTGTACNNTTGSDCSMWAAYDPGDGTDPGAITWSAQSSLSTARAGRIWVLTQTSAGPPPPTIPVAMAPYTPTY